ncbi:hypothetical protein SVAN01_04529 [Stagonosporopsis vannaccii]|nr:hypothetical protein SVAN01_04529 [Stagonosporopsis vannaccii]
MRIAIVGANGSIGGRIFEHILRRDDVDRIIQISRKTLSVTTERVYGVVIPDFGDLESVPEEAWTLVQDADVLIWAMGTYDLNENVNFKYPLEFQKRLFALQKRSRVREGRKTKFRFILLGGAFTETSQSRWLYFLPEQRRMKGLLQTKTIELAKSHDWAVHIVRPGGVLMGDNWFTNKVIETMFGKNLIIHGDELGAFVAEVAVNGSERDIIENLEMVDTGRQLSARGA